MMQQPVLLRPANNARLCFLTSSQHLIAPGLTASATNCTNAEFSRSTGTGSPHSSQPGESAASVEASLGNGSTSLLERHRAQSSVPAFSQSILMIFLTQS